MSNDTQESSAEVSECNEHPGRHHNDPDEKLTVVSYREDPDRQYTPLFAVETKDDGIEAARKMVEQHGGNAKWTVVNLKRQESYGEPEELFDDPEPEIRTDGGQEVGGNHHYKYDSDRKWVWKARVHTAPFSRMVQSLDHLVNSATVEVHGDGITVSARDPAHVCGIEIDQECGVKGLDPRLSVCFDVTDLAQNIPGYFDDDDYYELTLTHQPEEGDELDVFSVAGGSYQVRAYDPESHNYQAQFPDIEEGYQTEFSVQAHKLRGFLYGLACTDTAIALRLTPEDGHVVGQVVDKEGGEHEVWAIDAETRPDKYSYYSNDYLRDIAMALPQTGDATVKFGRSQPLLIEAADTKTVLAPRIPRHEDGDRDE